MQSKTLYRAEGLMEIKLRDFLEDYESKIIPLFKETNLTFFNATTSGDKETYQKVAELEIEISKYFADRDLFEMLKEIKDSNQVTDELLKRQLELIFTRYYIDF